jgi:hypothetical protein
MALSEKVIEQAWKRAGGKCECKRWSHKHSIVRCGKELVFSNKGKAGQGRWEVRQIDKLAGETVANCEILCADCYKQILYE